MYLILSAIPNPQSEIDGSPTWQIVAFLLAGCLIAFELIRGWRLGIMRQLMRVVAVAAGYAAAYWGGDLLVPYLRSSLQVPDVVISLLGGAILAVVIYAILSSLGTLLFKRTSQQETSKARLAYGISGAFLGLCFAAFFIWLALAGVRTIGSIAEAQVQARPKVAALKELDHQSSPTSEPSLEKMSDSVTTALARLKNSVELGPVGDVVKKADVMPNGAYQTLGEAGTVLANPDAARRFFEFPGVRELSENPKIIALRNDPEISEMIAQGRLFDLLRDPRVISAVNDPALAKQVKQFDLKGALEHAKGTQPTPR